LVEEIVAGVEDLNNAVSRRRSLVAPAVEIAPHVFEIADGPAVKFVSAEKNAIQKLVLKVASIENARRFLTEKDMLGSITGNQLIIAPEKIYGLDVRLVGEA